MDFTVVKVSALKQLADLKANILDGGEMILFQNDYTPTPDTIIGDLTVATFTGYADVTLTTYSDPYLTADQRAAVLAPLAQFNAASPFTVGNAIYGFAIKDVDGALVLAGRFPDAPIAMAGLGDHIAALVEYVWGNP